MTEQGKPNPANMKYIYELDGEKFFKQAMFDEDMKAWEASRKETKPVFTMQDFFDGVRAIVAEAREWWDRECSQKENERLKVKYGITSPLTDEKIVNMYLAETSEQPKAEGSAAKK